MHRPGLPHPQATAQLRLRLRSWAAARAEVQLAGCSDRLRPAQGAQERSAPRLHSLRQGRRPASRAQAAPGCPAARAPSAARPPAPACPSKWGLGSADSPRWPKWSLANPNPCHGSRRAHLTTNAHTSSQTSGGPPWPHAHPGQQTPRSSNHMPGLRALTLTLTPVEPVVGAARLQEGKARVAGLARGDHALEPRAVLLPHERPPNRSIMCSPQSECWRQVLSGSAATRANPCAVTEHAVAPEVANYSRSNNACTEIS